MFEFIQEIFIWWFILEILGLLTFPLTLNFSKNLHDRGYGISKILAILLLAYFTWILVSITPLTYGIFSILISLGILLSISFYFFTKIKRTELKKFFTKNRKLILTYELFFLIAFLFFIGVRYYDNSILDAEKYQDFMILNGLLRAEKFPFNDPWFSGYSLQYYYFGHLIIATLTKISGISSAITYNLALAMLFSLTLILSFSILYNLTKKIFYGFLGSLLVGIVGNFRAIIQIVLEKKFLPFNYWPSAHYIIPGTINEFPYWSFLHADLHAHVISIPFTILVLILTLNLFRAKGKFFTLFGDSIVEKLSGVFLFSISIGALAFLNAWDFPTYLLIAILGITMHEFFSHHKKINVAFLKHTIILIITLIFLSFTLFLPYHLSFHPVRPLGIVSERTELQYFLIIYALFLFIIFSFLLVPLKKYKIKFLDFSFLDIIILLMLIVTLILKSLVFLLLIFIFISLFLLIMHLVPSLQRGMVRGRSGGGKDTKGYTFSLMLLLTGLLLALGIEFFYIDDAFVGKLERVNTVFKIGMQIWILLAISSSYGLFYLKENFLGNLRKMNFPRYLWFSFLVVLISLSLLFPFLATPTKTLNNFKFFGSVATLDGMAYLKKLKFCDYDALTWANKNIKGMPVILEAPGDSFKWQSCVSSNTGLPTLLGWEGHERQWRPSQLGEITKRKQDVDRIYSSSPHRGGFRERNKEVKISNDWQGINWEGDGILTKGNEGVSRKLTAIKISSEKGANANFRQKISLEDNSYYKLTAQIKTQGIEKVGDVGKVAQILVRKDLNNAPGDIIAESLPLLGNNYWTKVEIDFFLPKGEHVVWISCVLGNWGKVKGKIWFDDFSLYKQSDEGIILKEEGEKEEEEKQNLEEVLSLIKKYNIEYIYIGKLERERYLPESLEKFDEISDFDVIYNTPEVKIYKVKNKRNKRER
jgi:YYY domain-containing protein